MTPSLVSSLPFHLDKALNNLADMELQSWIPSLESHLEHVFRLGMSGKLSQWPDAFQLLSLLSTTSFDFNSPRVSVGKSDDCSNEQRDSLRQLLMSLSPWRKGPFEFFGITVDAEWRSDWKWDRLMSGIESLAGRRVLDIGCGNGYYAFRMLGAGAAHVVGVDPSLSALMQFTALCSGLPQQPPISLLPIGIDQVPDRLPVFDTVFSMGVLYHRRSPLDHLYHIRHLLRPGGELVLETLVIDGGKGHVLLPSHRYAQMRNIWFIPSVDELVGWLKRIGFQRVQCINESVTTVQEQRSTPWMKFHSLSQFLDPNDPQLTVEGYPAPKRVILTAIAP
ncbi:MAG: tRNA 5-methoxyuridine(34)/uridine 5-oxyacetic acid(34) synthase CmoB [Coxiella sp. (in: Bacteria)]|nr:MAG: tRNA 5-methoxyuridine(34)/uridine 5-oxyacetic acid(34) synthase CmoB [Coxiella sp. (in: g-proteobacteria)]